MAVGRTTQPYAATLDAATLGAAAVVVHSGCRGGHTRSHARRLLVQAMEPLAPIARSANALSMADIPADTGSFPARLPPRPAAAHRGG